jgi:hypothetical protein
MQQPLYVITIEQSMTRGALGPENDAEQLLVAADVNQQEHPEVV